MENMTIGGAMLKEMFLTELPQDHSYISLTGELIEQFRLGKL